MISNARTEAISRYRNSSPLVSSALLPGEVHLFPTKRFYGKQRRMGKKGLRVLSGENVHQYTDRKIKIEKEDKI